MGRAALSSSRTRVLGQDQAQQQERNFVSVSRVAFAADGVDVDKSVQTITDLFMVARDEVCILRCFTPWMYRAIELCV